ncbi:DUF2191 domain-containing protein [bacterium]|nr:MAG: DUF2191 domain-containing protein [bacterium]
MRTTLTIDDNIDSRLRNSAKKLKITYKEIINKALEKGLERLEVTDAGMPYTVQADDYGLKPGIDSAKLNQLYDEFEAEKK